MSNIDKIPKEQNSDSTDMIKEADIAADVAMANSNGDLNDLLYDTDAIVSNWKRQNLQLN